MNEGNDPINSEHISNNISYFHLICLDENLNRDNDNQFGGIIQNLEQIVCSSQIFSNSDQCVDYITNIQDHKQKAILLYSGEHAENIIPSIQDIPQIDSIYILRRNGLNEEECRLFSPKVKYEYDDLTSICKSIKQTIRKYYQDYLTLPCLQPNIKTVKSNHNELEPSFMYMLIIKEIFLDPEFKPKHFDEFIDYCCRMYHNNAIMHKKVMTFKQEYDRQSPVEWYANTGSLFWIVNDALRDMNVDLILKLDFFIRELHQQIVALHSEQYGNYKWNSFDVYRGQVVPPEFFDKLLKTQGGLLSFNNFLSTTRDQGVSFRYADPGQPDSTKIGLLFRIVLDPTIKSNVFADIRVLSPIPDEEEVLFSMHSIFRLGEIKPYDNDHRIWEASLTLTTDTDAELCEIAETIRTDAQGSNSWERLGHLLVKMNLPKQAELIYETSLENTTTEFQKVHIYHQLGVIQMQQGDFEAANQYYECSQKIYQDYELLVQAASAAVEIDLGDLRSEMNENSETLSFDQKELEMIQKSLFYSPHMLATSINNMGALYDRQGESRKAIEYYEKALKMREKSLPTDHPLLAASYCSTGTAYSDVGDYSKAICYQKKGLEIQRKSRPAYHPETALSYNSLGSTYFKMGDYPTALSYYKEALNIQVKCLLADHPDLATSYNNIGEVYSEMGDYSKAELYHRRALKMREECLSKNHPETAVSYNNLGATLSKREDYLEAISCFGKAVVIQQSFLSKGHPDLVTSYHNMGKTYYEMGDYSKAIAFSREALVVKQKYPSINFASLGAIYTNLGSAYLRMANHSEAKLSYEKALEIEQESLSKNHRELAICNDNLGSVHLVMEEYPISMSYYEKALTIRKKHFSKDHPQLAASFENLGLAYCRMRNYSEALSYYEEGLRIYQGVLSESDPQLAITFNNVGLVYNKMRRYSEALSCFKKVLKIQEESLAANDHVSGVAFINIGLAYSGMGEHSKAISYYIQGTEIQHKSLGSNHPELASCFHNIASECYSIGMYRWALFFELLAVDIGQRKLATNHSHNIQYRQTLDFIKQTAFVLEKN